MQAQLVDARAQRLADAAAARGGHRRLRPAARADDIDSDHWNVLVIDTAPYVIAEIGLGRLSLVPGLRFEPVLIEGEPARSRPAD